MKKSQSQTRKKNFHYPDQTKGSRLAAQIREEANLLTEKERSELFERGMQIVYGGSKRKEKIRSGH